MQVTTDQSDDSSDPAARSNDPQSNQTHRTHRFNIENPTMRMEKATGPDQQQSHYFSCVYRPQEVYN
jgi:hypothetical protein